MNYRNFTLITADSRKVIPGALFVAIKGYSSDGHDYIQAAIEKGAKGVICEKVIPGLTGDLKQVEFEVVENSRKAHNVLYIKTNPLEMEGAVHEYFYDGTRISSTNGKKRLQLVMHDKRQINPAWHDFRQEE